VNQNDSNTHPKTARTATAKGLRANLLLDRRLIVTTVTHFENYHTYLCQFKYEIHHLGSELLTAFAAIVRP